VTLVLVRLKLALLRAGLRTAGIQGRLGAAFSVLVAVAVGLAGGGLLSFARLLDDRGATDAVSAGLGFLLLVWVLGPIVTATSDGTLDPDRLAPFPLTRRQLVPGLLLASLIGFGGIVSVLVLLGALAGVVPVSPLAVIAMAGVTCHLLCCAAASRLVGTAISGAARTRRWRDIALLAGPVVALVLNVGLQLVTRSFAPRDGASIDGVRTAARVLGGPAALAVGLAGEGNVVGSVAALVAGIALLAALVTAWGSVLERVLTSGGNGGVRAGKAAGPLRPRMVAFLPAGRAGAVAAKELRMTWREPRQRVAFLGTLFGAVVPLFSLRLLSSSSPRIALAAAVPAFILGTQATNQFGFDGPAHWVSVATGDDPRPELVGKNLARLVLAIPFVVLGGTALALRSGSFDFVVPAMGLAAAGFGIAVGLGNWFSVTSAVPVPASASNVFSAGNAGHGLAAAGPALAVLFGGALVLSPLFAALVMVDSRPVLQLLGVAGAVGGVGAWIVGTGAAVRYARPRQPELLAVLSA
jgi:ABC-2 type transport system permease protein